MTAETVAIPMPSTAKLVGYWRSFLVALKTCVVILAVIGAAHVTEPLRADAAVVQPVKGKAVKGDAGKTVRRASAAPEDGRHRQLPGCAVDGPADRRPGPESGLRG